MKKRCITILIFCISILGIGLVTPACTHKEPVSHTVNADLIDHVNFYLDTEEVGHVTLTRGTIFVREDKDNPGEPVIQISAWVEVDENDWGGISFNIPQGWEVQSVISDYPQEYPDSETKIVVFQTASEDVTWHRIVEVGCSHLGVPKGMEGTGNLIIELVPESNGEELPDTCSILIGAGSKGDTILHPVHQTYEVSIR